MHKIRSKSDAIALRYFEVNPLEQERALLLLLSESASVTLTSALAT